MPHTPPRPLRIAGVILWPAFMAAVLLTLAIFVLIDPHAPGALSGNAMRIADQITLYSLGFFLCWLAATLSSTLTWLLLRPAPPPPSRIVDDSDDGDES